MTTTRLHVLALATAGCAVIGNAQVTAQESSETAKFAAPKRIKAGDTFLGEGRLYPSPAMHHVDGDTHPDIVIGDLFGRVTYAPREITLPTVKFGAEKQLKDRSGEQLKFHNW